MANTSAPVGGTVTSGAFRDRSNDNFPDAVQEMRAQARAEHDFVTGKITTRPAYTTKGPTVEDNAAAASSNRTRAEAEALGEF